MNNNELPSTIKRKQYILAASAIISLLAMSTIWIVIEDSGKENNPVDIKAAKKKISLSGITDGVNAEDRWLASTENNIESLSKQLEQEKESKKNLEQKMQELFDLTYQIKEKSEEAESKNKELDTTIAELKAQLEQKTLQLNNGGDIAHQQNILPRKISNREIDLVGGASSKNTFDAENYLPAGSYAEAIVISGADASVGVSSQGNPVPAELRIMGKAISGYKDGEYLETDISGCTITAGVTGDLSSEKGYFRLLKMTCSKGKGKGFEVEVKGHVVSKGKSGMRGEVVSREGDFITKSFLAGLASGLGGGFADRMSSPSITIGNNPQKPPLSDLFASGLGKGVQNSSNRTAEYLIQRAEQYQPVISLPAGAVVEVAFTEGTYLDGRKKE